MATPTQDQVNAAIATWRDTSIGIGAIAANTPAYNQIFNTLGQLGTDVFTGFDGTAMATATSTLTFTAGTIADDILQLGTVYYVFVTTPSGTPDGSLATPFQVAKGANATAALANLRKAINATGVAGTDYSSTLTTAHPLANASASNATTLTANANVAGADGNLIATTVTVVSTADGFAWTGTTLAGGTGDNVKDTNATIDTWRDTMRCNPINKDDASDTQLDAAIPALKTSIAALIT